MGDATVNVEPISKEAAACWGVEAVNAHTAAQDPVTQAYAAILGLIGTVGLIRQWDALDRSLDIAQEQVDVAKDYYDLAERNYDEVTLRAFTCQKDLFDRYVSNFQSCVDDYVSAGKSPKEYTPDYPLYEGRAMAGVGAQFSRLRQRRQRQRDKYGTGACCNENLQLDVAMAAQLTEAANRGYRHEDARRFQYDQWYWAKCSDVANLISQMRAHVISGVNGGVANATGGIGAIGNAVGRVNQAAAGQQGALENIASFFGTLSNGAFGLAGGVLGYNSIGGGSQFNLPGLTNGPQTPTTSSLLQQAPQSGYAPGTKLGPAIGEPTVVPGGTNLGYSLSQGYYGGS